MVHKILGYLDPPKHSVAVWRHGSAYRWRKVIFIFSLGSAINVPYCWEKCYCIYNIVNDNNKELYLHRTFHSGTAGQTALQQQSCLLGYQLISSACIGLENIRTETEFQAILVHCDSVPTMSSKKRRKQNSGLADYVVEEISTQADHNDETELRRIYYSCIDSESVGKWEIDLGNIIVIYLRHSMLWILGKPRSWMSPRWSPYLTWPRHLLS